MQQQIETQIWSTIIPPPLVAAVAQSIPPECPLSGEAALPRSVSAIQADPDDNELTQEP